MYSYYRKSAPQLREKRQVRIPNGRDVQIDHPEKCRSSSRNPWEARPGRNRGTAYHSRRDGPAQVSHLLLRRGIASSLAEVHDDAHRLLLDTDGVHQSLLPIASWRCPTIYPDQPGV